MSDASRSPAPSTDAADYRERLVPSWPTWIVAAGLVAMISIAYGAALGSWAGWGTALASSALATALLIITAPVITVSTSGIRVGRANLPVRSIEDVVIVDRDRIRELRGPGSDGRVFVAVRPGAAPDGILITLDDNDDPHPAWLLSSRHPDRLAASLAATMGRP